MKIIFKVLIFVIVSVVLICIGFLSYLFVYKKPYTDTDYGFTISDQHDWYPTQKVGGVHYAIGTADKVSKKVISSLNINPTKHTPSADRAELASALAENCTALTQEVGHTNKQFKEISFKNLSGYLCINEGKPMNVDATYIFRQYFILSGDDREYDFVISASYPKGNTEEEEMVNTLLKNLTFR